MPSGREEAIETLVDMDPQGSFFRAARVLVSFIAVATCLKVYRLDCICLLCFLFNNSCHSSSVLYHCNFSGGIRSASSISPTQFGYEGGFDRSGLCALKV